MNSRQATTAIHVTAVLFGLSGIFGALIQGSATLITAGRALFATLALLLFMMRTEPASDARSEVSELAAREVALHHRKQFSLDYQSETMEQLSRQMTKLDFNPVMPVRMQSGTRLVGARYCAVLGQIAAQFRFVDEAGKPYTLYQTRCQGEFSDLPVGNFEIEGTHVELWREAGLLMVLASSS
jgi:hypothetical protein